MHHGSNSYSTCADCHVSLTNSMLHYMNAALAACHAKTHHISAANQCSVVNLSPVQTAKATCLKKAFTNPHKHTSKSRSKPDIVCCSAEYEMQLQS